MSACALAGLRFVGEVLTNGIRRRRSLDLAD